MAAAACCPSALLLAAFLLSLILRPTNEAPTHSTRRRRRRRRRKFGHALNDSEDSSVIRPRASPSSVRLVRKQIFSFFPRETFTCLRCVIKRSALSRRGPSSSPCALPYACSLPTGTARQAVLHWPKRESISSAVSCALRFSFLATFDKERGMTSWSFRT